MTYLIQINTVLNFTPGESWLEISYLIASVFFIVGLKMLSRPETARRGNLVAAAGMALAIDRKSVV